MNAMLTDTSAPDAAANQRDEPELPDNTIRITVSGKERHYIGYATSLVQEKGDGSNVLELPSLETKRAA